MTISKRIIHLMLAVIGVAYTLSAQITSPYSMYGYGLLRNTSTSTQRQMGGIGYAMAGGRQVNVMNPASYAAIDSMTFLWDIGADLSFNSRSEQRGETLEKGHGTGGGLDYVTMQFPLCKFMGASAGVVPYSNVGYSFGDKIQHGNLSNQGNGGINKAYLGVAGKVGGFSLGANVSYDFGNIINDVYAYTTSGNQTLFEHVIQVRDWDVTLGAQYTAGLGNFSSMTVGATYTPKKSLHGRTWAAQWDITAESAADTLANVKLAGKYYRPDAIGAGLSFRRARSSSLMVEADFGWQNWSKCGFPALTDSKGLPVVLTQTFNDRWEVAVGGEYVPRMRGNYLQRIAYRLGANYTRDYLTIGGNELKQYSLSCGFGFPTIEGKTIINLGFEWIHRACSPQAMVKENYFNITLGLNFNETWFFQRKIK